MAGKIRREAFYFIIIIGALLPFGRQGGNTRTPPSRPPRASLSRLAGNRHDHPIPGSRNLSCREG